MTLLGWAPATYRRWQTWSFQNVVKTFFKTTSVDKIHLVVTSNGSTIKNPSGFKSVSDIVKSKNNEDAIINELVNSLV